MCLIKIFLCWKMFFASFAIHGHMWQRLHLWQVFTFIIIALLAAVVDCEYGEFGKFQKVTVIVSQTFKQKYGVIVFDFVFGG